MAQNQNYISYEWIPQGGMDKDSDLRALPEGYWRNAENIIKSEDYTGSLISNIKGNEEINTIEFLGNTKILGIVEDVENNLIYIFTAFEGYDNDISLYKLNKADKTLTVIIYIHNYNTEKYISGVIINNQLIFTNNYNSIRQIDLNNLSNNETDQKLYRHPYLDNICATPINTVSINLIGNNKTYSYRIIITF